MSIMNWKQNIGEGSVTPERAKELLRNFQYPTEIDDKGHLLIEAGMSKLVVAFRDNGPDSTLIGVSHIRMKFIALVLFVILIILFVVPGVIFSLILNAQRKKVFQSAVQTINNNLIHNTKSDSENNINAGSRLEQLQNMKNQGLINDEEFQKKREEIIKNM